MSTRTRSKSVAATTVWCGTKENSVIVREPFDDTKMAVLSEKSPMKTIDVDSVTFEVESLIASQRNLRKRSSLIPTEKVRAQSEMVAAKKKKSMPKKESKPKKEVVADDSGSEEIDAVDEPPQIVTNFRDRVEPPQTIFSVGEIAAKLFPKLQAKNGLTKRKTKDEFCIACLDYKLANGTCSNTHDDNDDRIQKFWKEEFPHKETLTKESVLEDLYQIAENWV